MNALHFQLQTIFSPRLRVSAVKTISPTKHKPVVNSRGQSVSAARRTTGLIAGCPLSDLARAEGVHSAHKQKTESGKLKAKIISVFRFFHQWWTTKRVCGWCEVQPSYIGGNPFAKKTTHGICFSCDSFMKATLPAPTEALQQTKQIEANHARMLSARDEFSTTD